ALGMTLFTLATNVCFAQTKAPAQVSKASATAHVAQKVPLNTATLEQLETITGLGKKKDQAVLDYIAQNGAIKNETKLTEVKGIGEKLAVEIITYVDLYRSRSRHLRLDSDILHLFVRLLHRSMIGVRYFIIRLL